MLSKSVSLLAALALASGAVAEPQPYDPAGALPDNHVFGVMARDAPNSVYQPTAALCNKGATCAEACGDGFAPCSGNTTEVHCYNQGGGQTCCAIDGNSCDSGFYCAATTDRKSVCCPNGMDTNGCAAALKIGGALTSQVPSSSSASATANGSAAAKASSGAITSAPSGAAGQAKPTSATTTSAAAAAGGSFLAAVAAVGLTVWML